MTVDPVTAAWTALGMAVTGALGALGTWAAQRVLGKAAFQNAINTGFDTLLRQVQAANLELREELATQRRECAAEIAQVRGELANAQQTAASLAAMLQRAGILNLPAGDKVTSVDALEWPMHVLTDKQEPPKDGI